MENDKGWMSVFGVPLGPAAVMFGVGVLTGFFFRKWKGVGVGAAGGGFDTVQRTMRLAAIRAQGLGRNHKMVFVVRCDLKMEKGKIAAQCCHAAVMCYQKALVMDIKNLDMWEATGAAKICLKAGGDEKVLKELQQRARDLNIVTAIVRDAGHTQVAPGTMTVLGIGPAPVDEINKVTGHLSLL